MQTETTTTATPSVREFVVPVELMKTFKADVRFLPHVLPINGWIIFDRAMLVAALRSNNPEERMNLATQIDKLGKIGGELILVETQQRVQQR